MIICFFTDIHGNKYSFDCFIEKVKHQKIDLFVFGGDILGYYYACDEIIDELKSHPDILCLLGNHDKMFLDAVDNNQSFDKLILKYGNGYLNIKDKIKPNNISFLKTLKPFHQIYSDDLNIGFFHGGPDDPINMRIYPDTIIEDHKAFDKFDYIFCGHTHHKMVRKIGRCTVINPGSIGQQRDGKGCSYVLFDTIKQSFYYYIVDYNKEALINDINNQETNEPMKAKLIEVLLRKNKF